MEPYEELANEGQAQYCFGCLRQFTDLDKQVGNQTALNLSVAIKDNVCLLRVTQTQVYGNTVII